MSPNVPKAPKSAPELISEGRAAAELMKHPQLVEAFARLEAKCMSDMRLSKTVEEREKAHSMLLAADQLQNELRALVSNGAIAARQTANRSL